MAINENLLAEIARTEDDHLGTPLRVPVTASQFGSRHRNTQHLTSSGHVRKRHWFLGSLVILAGSWITHTTTATIAQEPSTAAMLQDSIETHELAKGVPNESDINDESVEEATIAADTASDNKARSQASAPIEQVALVSRPRVIKKGESLGTIFRQQGLDLAIPHHVSRHPVAQKLTNIRAGKTIDFRFDETELLQEIRYPVSALEELVVTLDGVQVASAAVHDIEFETKQRTVSAEISSSLYLAAQNAGLSNNLIMDMVQIFGWDIDFVQDIRVGDNFHIVFDEYHKDGKKLRDGFILAAEFTTQGRTHRAIRFEDKDGVASYFNDEGESMLGTFLRSPVEFSRISSRFGKRKHPISKKWKAHKGVDYAASRGTPIRATADGKITLAGRKGGYGNTVVLRHAGRFSTLYAHMQGFAKGIKAGTRVKQGQTIGYVGSTGMSTGPHLHYEFRVDGVHRNPLTYKTPKASSVSEENMPRFRELSEVLAKQLDAVKQSYQLAKAETDVKKI